MSNRCCKLNATKLWNIWSVSLHHLQKHALPKAFSISTDGYRVHLWSCSDQNLWRQPWLLSLIPYIQIVSEFYQPYLQNMYGIQPHLHHLHCHHPGMSWWGILELKLPLRGVLHLPGTGLSEQSYLSNPAILSYCPETAYAKSAFGVNLAMDF